MPPSVQPSVAWDKVIGPLKRCVEQVRAFYTRLLYPRMTDGQLAFVVPGAFASTHNPDCDTSCYDAMFRSDALDFYDWLLADARIVGMVPWHWQNQPWGGVYTEEIGVVGMNQTRDAFAEIGQKLVGGPNFHSSTATRHGQDR